MAETNQIDNRQSKPRWESPRGYLRRMGIVRNGSAWLIPIIGICLFPSQASTRFLQPELERVPVERLARNLEQKISENPDDAAAHLNLARVYAMAFAQKSRELQVNKRNPDVPWFSFVPPHVPFGAVIELDGAYAQEHGIDANALKAMQDLAQTRLRQSIEQYRAALKLDPDNPTVQLGLAWVLDQAGDEEEAVERYRAIVSQAWEKEKDLKSAGLTFQSVVQEAAGYLLPHLDPEHDAAEIKDLQAKIQQVRKILRPVTPLAIPLGPNRSFDAVDDDRACVRFDADGSGIRRRWSWITPQAGWIVLDLNGSGQVDSALQLFGSVSFWCFWRDGFDALDALDDNRDGWISGGELKGLSIWCDVNQNGISDPGEVQSLAAYQIVGLASRSAESSARTPVAWNPRGVRYADSSTGPVYDVILRRCKSSRGWNLLSPFAKN